MKLLIVYGTTEGQTRKICEFLRDQAQKAGHDVSLVDSTGADVHPKGLDAVIIAGSLHAHKYQSSIEHYVQKHYDALNAVPSAFVSVSLTAAQDEPDSWKELRQITQEFIDTTGWEPTIVEQVAGALRYTEYNFLKKFLMRMIAQKSGGSTDTSKDHEYTDWDQVKRIIERLEKTFNDAKQAAKMKK